jgi:hypothetical protein
VKTVYSCVYQADILVMKSLFDSSSMRCEILSGGKLDVNPFFSTGVTGYALAVGDEDEEDALALLAEFKSPGGNN